MKTSLLLSLTILVTVFGGIEFAAANCGRPVQPCGVTKSSCKGSRPDSGKPCPRTYTGNVELLDRVCVNCSYVLRQGYITQLTSPYEGRWDLTKESLVVINGKVVTVDPKINGRQQYLHPQY
jgi:hypothetical protein